MFTQKTKPVLIEGANFEVWTNVPRGEFTEARKDGDIALLQLCVVGWDIGGTEFGGYTYPDAPTAEAIAHLPIDVSTMLAVAAGEAIVDGLPKPKKASSGPTTTR